ncbi:MAG: UDP-N-acetylmuramate: L-alanyl-gamma-D-glutamyl-meso-diaminopimelate ligase [Gammaproteobacteria bacterium]|jgi:UDP-N-acetylmuramate: L-alanyl-gamma-D-glutamyl-meso-diaminopimelate ligase
MKIHILGICGTFMGSIAVLAKQLGHEVSGSDANVYPPMSTQLQSQGIELMDGYLASHLSPAPDMIVVGNTVSRGNIAVEYLLNEGLPFQSGPEWLAQHVLKNRHVLAVAGTHGKTTTSSMLAWILEYAGKSPGFLIGGIAENFGISARYSESNLFVVEADEYDTAFFDKRSKFIHYHPRTLLINNIEYDHADIFENIEAIRREFNHMVRIVPANGQIVRHAHDKEIDQVMAMGCWTPTVTFGGENGQWSAQPEQDDFSCFNVCFEGERLAQLTWSLFGQHNAENALAAIACAAHVDVEAHSACAALAEFTSVKRRLQVLGCVKGVTVYDDFAHHPTAIAATLSALKARVGPKVRIIAVMEPRSNTMKMGVHRDTLATALAVADLVLVYEPAGLAWDLQQSLAELQGKCRVFNKVEPIIEALVKDIRDGDQILIMSNGDFQGIHQDLLNALR